MRVAFTSCTSVRLVPNQPVWTDILGHQPQHVVLLGDNIYNDVPGPGIDALKKMNSLEFAEHLAGRYRKQLAQPQFQKLITNPSVQMHAIWDDHDFAWDNAEGGRLLAEPGQREKIYISTSCMRAFRRALAGRDPNLFPKLMNDPALWADSPPQVFQPLGSTSVQLESDGRSWLHLTDGRTWRKKPNLLGPKQREMLDGYFKDMPDALHVIASGSTFGDSGGWSRYSNDLAWLDERLNGRTALMLCGDIHKYRLKSYPLSHGHLIEAVASGAALVELLDPVITGDELRNFGLLDIEPDRIRIQLFAFNVMQLEETYLRTAGGGLVPLP